MFLADRNHNLCSKKKKIVSFKVTVITQNDFPTTHTSSLDNCSSHPCTDHIAVHRNCCYINIDRSPGRNYSSLRRPSYTDTAYTPENCSTLEHRLCRKDHRNFYQEITTEVQKVSPNFDKCLVTKNYPLHGQLPSTDSQKYPSVPFKLHSHARQFGYLQLILSIRDKKQVKNTTKLPKVAERT